MTTMENPDADELSANHITPRDASADVSHLLQNIRDIYGRGPSQYFPYDIILWYVSKIIYLS